MTSAEEDRQLEYVKQIPNCFHELAKEVALFYHPTELIIIRLLIRYNCLDEIELESKLEMDTRLLQGRLSVLRYDRIIQERFRMTRDQNGKLRKVHFYFLNFKSLSNVIKYKLLQLGSVIKELASKRVKKDYFICTACARTFDELKAGQLFDAVEKDFYCTYCHALVEENKDEVMIEDAVSTADFNERTTRLERILKMCDGYKLDESLFEPVPHQDESEMKVNFSDRPSILQNKTSVINHMDNLSD